MVDRDTKSDWFSLNVDQASPVPDCLMKIRVDNRLTSTRMINRRCFFLFWCRNLHPESSVHAEEFSSRPHLPPSRSRLIKILLSNVNRLRPKIRGKQKKQQSQWMKCATMNIFSLSLSLSFNSRKQLLVAILSHRSFLVCEKSGRSLTFDYNLVLLENTMWWINKKKSTFLLHHHQQIRTRLRIFE